MDYRRIVPPGTFLGRYLRYMQSQETASIYDFYCGLWCISTVCGRYAYVSRPRAPVYLNLFVVLVGESGVARKTTSIRVAGDVVRGIVGRDKEIGMLDAKVTPEKLDELLHERSLLRGTAQISIAVPELAVFLGTERYIAHMPTLLTDLYDCPSHREGGGTIARGAVMQKNIWVNFLSASTPVWLLKTVNPNVVEGGFTSRCYFIISNTPKKRIPWPEDSDKDLFQDICDDAKIIAAEAQLRGAVTVHPDAVRMFSTWYNDRIHALDPFKQSFESREDAHVLRLAALLCINDGSWIIKRSHINIAIRLTSAIKQDSGAIFEDSEARTKFAQALDVVRAALLSKGMDPIPRHRLFQKCRVYVSNDEFSTLLDVMHEIGAIQRFHLQKDQGGRPGEWVRGTQMIMSKGLGESVLERFSTS